MTVMLTCEKGDIQDKEQKFQSIKVKYNHLQNWTEAESRDLCLGTKFWLPSFKSMAGETTIHIFSCLDQPIFLYLICAYLTH